MNTFQIKITQQNQLACCVCGKTAPHISYLTTVTHTDFTHGVKYKYAVCFECKHTHDFVDKFFNRCKQLSIMHSKPYKTKNGEQTIICPRCGSHATSHGKIAFTFHCRFCGLQGIQPNGFPLTVFTKEGIIDYNDETYLPDFARSHTETQEVVRLKEQEIQNFELEAALKKLKKLLNEKE